VTPLDRIRLLVASVPWRATDYVAPHEYVMADWNDETEELVRLVMQEVRGRDGYLRVFRGVPFPTWHLDDHYYWMMPWVGEAPKPLRWPPPGDTWPPVLNRARLPVLQD
jgi:hypothetical protein